MLQRADHGGARVGVEAGEVSRVAHRERRVEHEGERRGHRLRQVPIDRIGVDLGMGAVAQPVGRDRRDERCEASAADASAAASRREMRTRSSGSGRGDGGPGRDTRSSGDGGPTGAARRSTPAAVTTTMQPTSAVSLWRITRLSFGSTAMATPAAVRLRITVITARRREIRPRRSDTGDGTLNRSDRGVRRPRAEACVAAIPAP